MIGALIVIVVMAGAIVGAIKIAQAINNWTDLY